MSDVPIPPKIGGYHTSDVGSQYLKRPNEGLIFADGKTYGSGKNFNFTPGIEKYEPDFDGPRQESAYWDNDITYQKMLKQIQSMPVGSAERNALVAQLADYKANKFNNVEKPIPRNPSSPPKTYPPTAAATPTTPAATPTAASAPATPPATPASNPGFMTSPQGAPTLGAPAGAASPASTQNTPASQPAKTGLSADQISELKRRYEDALQMPLPTDPQMAQQQREYTANLKKELGRAMLGAMDQTVAAGMGSGVPILQAREAAVRADNIVRAKRQTDKDNVKAEDVLKQAQEYYKGDPKSPEFKAWLKSQGYTETGHKFKENMFDKAARQKAEDPKGENPNNFTPAQIEAIKTQRAKELEPKPTTGMDIVKSQLNQMYKAGHIDEATFRKGMNDPYSNGRIIEAIYDDYVQRYGAKDPNQPFPDNSA